MTERLTIAHLTDAHLAHHGRLRPAELLGKRALTTLNWVRARSRDHDGRIAEALAEDIRAHAPDQIAMTGDLGNFGLAREYEAGAAWLAALGPAAAVGYVPGNHEALHPGFAPALEAAYRPFITGDDGEAGFPWLRLRGPVALIGLSTACATPPLFAAGAMGEAQAEALAALVPHLRGRLPVVMIHHPPHGRGPRRRALRDPQRLAALPGPALFLHGHNHRAELASLGPGRFALGAPSASMAPGRGKDVAEWRLIEITREEDWRITVNRRAWSGEGFADIGRFTLTAPASCVSAAG